MAISPDLYKKMAGARASKGGTRLRDGSYLFGIQRMYFEGGYKGLALKADLYILKSENDPEHAKEGDPSTHANPAGSSITYIWPLSNEGEKGDAQRGAAKSFGITLLDVDDSIPDEEYITQLRAFVEKNKEEPGGGGLAFGCQIAASTYRADTKKGESHVRPRWTAVAQTPEDIERTRELLKAVAAAAK